jgi:hypothetical protein
MSTPAESAEPLDPRTANPRELMQLLLPAARREYVRAWEFLADPATPLERRRAARTKAEAIAEDHGLVAAALRAREASLRGDDLLNARHLADELERHVSALGRIATIAPIGVQGSKDLRPESLGCGKRYRDPARVEAASGGTRGVSDRPKSSPRDRDRGARRDDRPRDPKPPKDALGSSKHDSSLGDDMDEATRAKLEALRKALEG